MPVEHIERSCSSYCLRENDKLVKFLSPIVIYDVFCPSNRTLVNNDAVNLVSQISFPICISDRIALLLLSLNFCMTVFFICISGQ